MATDEVKLHKMEALKESSQQLRGTIEEELQNDSDSFSADSGQLLKFHGTYQQDNRDLRNRKDEDGKKLGKVFSLMIRTALPGGRATASQFLAELDLADKFGNGTLRLTTRQAFQLHAIPKNTLRETINEINAAKMSSLAACGDVNRNVMCNPVPYKNNPVHDQMQQHAQSVADHLLPKTTAYYDLWVTDEDGNKTNEAFQPVEEPIYGKTYLPRKFKIGFARPEDNHVDVYTQDLGFLAIVENDEVIGYNVSVGGGMGRTPSAEKTYPALGKRMCYITPDQINEVSEAVVKVQRDFGNRSDRKVARMKYLVNNWGIEKFKAKVEEYYGKSLPEPNPADVTDVDDYTGWREQGDGKLFLGVNVENGRVKDEGDFRLKSALRVILNKYKLETRLTALQSIIFCDIDPADKSDIDTILKEHGIKTLEELTALRRYSIACPALPTCGLSITESERILPGLIDDIDAEAAKQGLTEERFAIHMTGCPNGCARPYTGDIGLVGRSVGKYTLFLGGDALGTRLNYIYKDQVPLEEITKELAPLFTYFKEGRENGESFGDFCAKKGKEDLLAYTGSE